MAQVGMTGRNGMDDLRDESSNDDRERMIECIMECEGVTYAEAWDMLHAD